MPPSTMMSGASGKKNCWPRRGRTSRRLATTRRTKNDIDRGSGGARRVGQPPGALRGVLPFSDGRGTRACGAKEHLRSEERRVGRGGESKRPAQREHKQ